MGVIFVETGIIGKINVLRKELKETNSQIVGAGVGDQQEEVVVKAMGGTEPRQMELFRVTSLEVQTATGVNMQPRIFQPALVASRLEMWTTVCFTVSSICA
jgi:hypothetical protein